MKTLRDYTIIAALEAAALACLTLAAACRGMAILSEIAADYMTIARHMAARIRSAWKLWPLCVAALLPVVAPAVAMLQDAWKAVQDQRPLLLEEMGKAWSFRQAVIAECRG